MIFCFSFWVREAMIEEVCCVYICTFTAKYWMAATLNRERSAFTCGTQQFNWSNLWIVRPSNEVSGLENIVFLQFWHFCIIRCLTLQDYVCWCMLMLCVIDELVADHWNYGGQGWDSFEGSCEKTKWYFDDSDCCSRGGKSRYVKYTDFPFRRPIFFVFLYIDIQHRKEKYMWKSILCFNNLLNLSAPWRESSKYEFICPLNRIFYERLVREPF